MHPAMPKDNKPCVVIESPVCIAVERLAIPQVFDLHQIPSIFQSQPIDGVL